jgi:hypothetical protein
MVSFVNYVLKFANEDNAAGDVAREMGGDTAINKRWGYKTLKTYVSRRYNIRPEVLVILRDLKARYDANDRYQQ